MSKSLSAIIAFIFVLFAQPLFVVGQDLTDWASVKALPAGMNVRAETKSKMRVDGSLKSVTDEEIILTTKNGTETVFRTDLKKVFQVESGSRGKWAAIGAAVGAGIGAGLGLALLGATGGSDNGSAVVAPIIAVGAGIGGGLGAAFPVKKRTLVFESK